MEDDDREAMTELGQRVGCEGNDVGGPMVLGGAVYVNWLIAGQQEVTGLIGLLDELSALGGEW